MKTGRVGRSATFYMLNAFLSRSVSFLMLPVYTRYLTPADYGTLAILQLVIEVAALALTAGLTTGVMRLYFKAEGQAERDTVVSTAMILEVGAAFVGFLLLLLLATPIATHLLNGDASPGLIRLGALNFLLTAIGGVPTLKLQIDERAATLSKVLALKLFLQVALNVLFVVGFDLKAAGIMWSTCFSMLLIHGSLAASLVREIKLRWDRATAIELRRFGVPYQLSTAGAFVLTFGDRLFLAPLAGSAAVGLYAMAYQFGFLLLQVSGSPFQQAWDPVRHRLVNEPPEVRDRQFESGFFLYSAIVLTAAVGICLTVESALKLLTTEEYWVAAKFVPAIVLAYVLAGWTLTTKFGIDVSEQTRYFTYATWSSVVTTVLLYATLIPPFGAHGAAWATVGGFAVRLAMTLYFAERLWPVRYGWPRVVKMFGAAAAVVIVIGPTGMLPEARLHVSALGMALFVGVIWSILSPAERAVVAAAFRNPRNVVRALAG